MKRYLIPFGVFVVLVAFLAIGLTLKPRELPSPLLDKPAPQFVLPTLNSPSSSLSTTDMRGQVWVLNVWASWCVACREEHVTMVEMAKLNFVPIYGLNYKDQRAGALGWLDQFGNPYVASLSDTDGLVGIDYGVYGVPETFVIDKAGVIRRKFVGPLTAKMVRDEIVPLVARLNS
jgi:cytochrome c biogenesis protein CcmG, thiol:disulfide interchange protein DsbE